MTRLWWSAVVLLSPAAAVAQQPQPGPSEWEKLPRMQLERQFAGPLQDTIIQRWRDTVDGTICYIYLPITAPHSPPVVGGYVQYGANTIGSISCTRHRPGHRRQRRRARPRVLLSRSDERVIKPPASS
jgi:hypothetical protein